MLRALVYRCTEMYTEELKGGQHAYIAKMMSGGNKELMTLASMAKLKAGRIARDVTDGCLQFWGGMGFMWESSVARFYRDARLISIGGGADEVMLSIIAKMMGILPSNKK